METMHLELEPNDPGQLLSLLHEAGDSRQLLGREIAPGIRESLLAASPEFFENLRRGSAPDPWKFGYAIIEKEHSLVIGMCGFTGPPDPGGVVEIAYTIAPEFQGKG